jgi:hypothetical protein
MATWLQPVVKGMLLCTDVLPGPAGSGNVHLMNVFASFRPAGQPPFPFHAPQFCVFLDLTDAEGEGRGQIMVRHAESDTIVFASNEHPIQFRSRLQRRWVLFRLHDCTFPGAGVYLSEFYLDGRWLGDQAFELRVPAP